MATSSILKLRDGLEVRGELDKSTDVMFFDLNEPKGQINVVSVNEDILIHIDMTTGDVVGMRIVNWSAFLARARREYRILRTKAIIQKVIGPLIEMARKARHGGSPQHRPALGHY